MMNETAALDLLLNPYRSGTNLDVGRLALSIALALLFGIALSFVYRAYYGSTEPEAHSIGRSFPLMTPAVTMIFQLIQYSLPLSLGLLGALSFVRFRTPVKRAEDIAFILVTIALGLACAVFSIEAALLLLGAVVAVALIKRTAPGLLGGKPVSGVLVTVHSSAAVDFAALEQALRSDFGTPVVVSVQGGGDLHALVFTLPSLLPARGGALIQAVGAVSAGAQVDVFFPDHQLAE